MLVDSHCHLNFPDFKEDFSGILQRAKDANIGIMQTICTKIDELPEIIKIAEQHSNIYASVGIHPNEVSRQVKITAEEIIEYTKHPKIIGIGETGLDFYYENSPRAEQIESFKEHIKAAQATNLPIIIHTRGADIETIEVLEQQLKKQHFTGLIHCFSTSKMLAERAIELGFYISISGILTFNKALALQEIVKYLPLDKLLVETDAPYLAPTPMRGKRNEPAFTKYTAQFLANLQGVDYEEVASKTTENFLKLFTKVKLADEK
jgi:TatD DNase family protein